MTSEWKTGPSTGSLGAFAYWIAMWAMTEAPIASVAALRETSILFAMAISVFALREKLTGWRIAAALLIVGGVIALDSVEGCIFRLRLSQTHDLARVGARCAASSVFSFTSCEARLAGSGRRQPGDQHFGEPDVARHGIAGPDAARRQQPAVAGQVEEDEGAVAEIAADRALAHRRQGRRSAG